MYSPLTRRNFDLNRISFADKIKQNFLLDAPRLQKFWNLKLEVFQDGNEVREDDTNGDKSDSSEERFNLSLEVDRESLKYNFCVQSLMMKVGTLLVQFNGVTGEMTEPGSKLRHILHHSLNGFVGLRIISLFFYLAQVLRRYNNNDDNRTKDELELYGIIFLVFVIYACVLIFTAYLSICNVLSSHLVLANWILRHLKVPDSNSSDNNGKTYERRPPFCPNLF